MIKSQVLYVKLPRIRISGNYPYLTSSELSVRPARYYIKRDRDVMIIIILRLNGKNLFQVRYIKLSYRIRGRVARTHTNNVAIIIVLIINEKFIIIIECPVMNTAVNRLIIKIFAYSAMKIRANLLLPYSTLKPDTNSDSPSAKSNGVRFVSAKLVMIHVAAIGIIIRDTQDIVFIVIIDISILWWIINADRRIKDIDTSYEMVWATPRRAPRRAYFEFEHHPAINVVYTFILDTHRK